MPNGPMYKANETPLYPIIVLWAATGALLAVLWLVGHV